MRIIYVEKKYHDQLRLSDFPNAGPHPCVAGMKKQFWGKDALCIRSGAFVYKVDEKTYNRAMSLSRR